MGKIRYERPLIKKLESGMPNKFGTRTEYQAMTHIDGNAVKNLVKQFGSPLFVISEKTIRSTFKKARKGVTQIV
jgi:diaminopimelate decarboxylase